MRSQRNAHMKAFIFITIVIIFNACQGRNMPIQTATPSNNTEKNTTSIPLTQTPVKTKDVTNNHKSPHEHKKSQEKKQTTTLPSSAQKKHVEHSVSQKNVSPSNDDLPPLPYIPSIDERQILTPPTPSPSRKYNTKPKDIAVDTIIDTQVAKPRESFSGGGIVSGLDMATIRIGKSSDYTSIIFDSYQFEGKETLPTKKASTSGTYLFTYEPSKKRIIGLIDGYAAFSALLNNQRELFSDNEIVKNIYVLKHLGNDGIKFVIKLRKNVRVNIFDVKNPGRIIVNLFPL